MATHVGRSYPGMGNPIEHECPCPKEPCGLVSQNRADPSCPEHPVLAFKTMRQSHSDDRCPGARRRVLRAEQNGVGSQE